jgi:hypothetical protein
MCIDIRFGTCEEILGNVCIFLHMCWCVCMYAQHSYLYLCRRVFTSAYTSCVCVYVDICSGIDIPMIYMLYTHTRTHAHTHTHTCDTVQYTPIHIYTHTYTHTQASNTEENGATSLNISRQNQESRGNVTSPHGSSSINSSNFADKCEYHDSEVDTISSDRLPVHNLSTTVTNGSTHGTSETDTILRRKPSTYNSYGDQHPTEGTVQVPTNCTESESHNPPVHRTTLESETPAGVRQYTGQRIQGGTNYADSESHHKTVHTMFGSQQHTEGIQVEINHADSDSHNSHGYRQTAASVRRAATNCAGSEPYNSHSCGQIARSISGFATKYPGSSGNLFLIVCIRTWLYISCRI